MPCVHLFISPIFATKIFIYKKLQAPQYCSGGPLSDEFWDVKCGQDRVDAKRHVGSLKHWNPGSGSQTKPS